MTLDWRQIRVTEGDLHRTPCDCCASTTTRAEGEIYGPAGWLGFYALRFAAGHPDRGVPFQIGTGNWADKVKAHRLLFRASYDPAGNGFAIVDMPADFADDVTALRRDQIIDTDFAPQAYAMLDAIYHGDSRLQGILA